MFLPKVTLNVAMLHIDEAALRMHTYAVFLKNSMTSAKEAGCRQFELKYMYLWQIINFVVKSFNLVVWDEGVSVVINMRVSAYYCSCHIK